MSSDQALTVQVLAKYLQLWDLVDGLVLHQGVPDQYRWKFTQPGSYSSKSAYAAFFLGPIRFAPWERIWKSWAPLCCKFSIDPPSTIGASQPTVLPSEGRIICLLALFVIKLWKQFSTSLSLVCLPGKYGR